MGAAFSANAGDRPGRTAAIRSRAPDEPEPIRAGIRRMSQWLPQRTRPARWPHSPEQPGFAAGQVFAQAAEFTCSSHEPSAPARSRPASQGAPLAGPASWSSWCANSCSTTFWPSCGSAAPASTSSQDRSTWPCCQDSPASTRRVSCASPAASAVWRVDDEGAGVDQHLAQVAEVAGAPVQQQQRRLHRDQHAHLVGDDQAGAADEGLLGQQHLGVFLHLQLHVGRQAGKGRHAPAQDFAPGAREGLAAHPRAAQRGQHGRAPQPAGHEQASGEEEHTEEGGEGRHAVTHRAIWATTARLSRARGGRPEVMPPSHASEARFAPARRCAPIAQ
jgi:hypothetical protein